MQDIFIDIVAAAGLLVFGWAFGMFISWTLG